MTMIYQKFNLKKIKKWQSIYSQVITEGIFAMWDGTKLVNKQGEEIVSVPHVLYELKSFYKDWQFEGVLSSDNIEKDIGQLLRKTKLILNNNVYFVIHELMTVGTFEERLSNLKRIVDVNDKVKLATTKEIDVAEIETLSGVFFKNGFGHYEPDNVTYRKDKLVEGEFTCIGFEAVKEHEKIICRQYEKGCKKYADGTFYKNGRYISLPIMGKMVCVTDNGKVFKVGTGFSKQERQYLWSIKDQIVNKKVKIKYKALTQNGIPKFPFYAQHQALR